MLFVPMNIRSQTCMNKFLAAPCILWTEKPLLRAFALLCTFGISPFCTPAVHKTAPSSCVEARKMPANARVNSIFAAVFLAALIILVLLLI